MFYSVEIKSYNICFFVIPTEARKAGAVEGPAVPL